MCKARVAYPTYRKYKTFTKQLQAFADSRGYVMLDQFRPGDIDVFDTKSTLAIRSKAKMRRAASQLLPLRRQLRVAG